MTSVPYVEPWLDWLNIDVLVPAEDRAVLDAARDRLIALLPEVVGATRQAEAAFELYNKRYAEHRGRFDFRDCDIVGREVQEAEDGIWHAMNIASGAEDLWQLLAVLGALVDDGASPKAGISALDDGYRDDLKARWLPKANAQAVDEADSRAATPVGDAAHLALEVEALRERAEAAESLRRDVMDGIRAIRAMTGVALDFEERADGSTDPAAS